MGKSKDKSNNKRAKNSGQSRADVNAVPKGAKTQRKGVCNRKGSVRYDLCSDIEFVNYLRNVELIIKPRLVFEGDVAREDIATIRGFSVIEMPGDGNCLFHSIADQLKLVFSNYGTACGGGSKSSTCSSSEISHEYIRNQVMGTISLHAEYFKLFHWDDDESFTEYIERLRSSGEWGGNSELVAASRFFHVNIYIFQEDSLPSKIEYDPSDTGFSPVSKAAVKRRKKRLFLPVGPSVVDSYPNLFLSFHGDCHYNSLHPLRIVAPDGGDCDVLHVNVEGPDCNYQYSVSAMLALHNSAAVDKGPLENEFSLTCDGDEDIVEESVSSGNSKGVRAKADWDKSNAVGKKEKPVLSKKEQRKLEKMFARKASLEGGGGGDLSKNGASDCSNGVGIFSGDMVII
jgi:hypothetical protein